MGLKFINKKEEKSDMYEWDLLTWVRVGKRKVKGDLYRDDSRSPCGG